MNPSPLDGKNQPKELRGVYEGYEVLAGIDLLQQGNETQAVFRYALLFLEGHQIPLGKNKQDLQRQRVLVRKLQTPPPSL